MRDTRAGHRVRGASRSVSAMPENEAAMDVTRLDMETLEARLGLRLARWRRLNGVKQAALAERLGVAQSTVSRWESGTLMPEGLAARRLSALLAARPRSAADRQILRLVTGAREPVHLVCDTTHRLLAASPGRAADWRRGLDAMLGASLWPHASPQIVAAEAALDECGWFTPEAPEIRLVTERHETALLTIEAGAVLWTRLPLSDGSFARLVRDGGPRGAAAA